MSNIKPCYEIGADGYILEHYLYSDDDIKIALEEGRKIVDFSWTTSFSIPRFNIELNEWEEGKGYDEIVASMRKQKFEELSMKCKEDILGYFEATVNSVAYLFSFDAEAQSNFTGTLILFNSGMITDIEWTAWDNGVPIRLVLSKDQLLSVSMEAFKHKDVKIARLRNEIQPKLLACTKVEEVNAVVW